MLEKTYVIDTNILLKYPYFLNNLEKCVVVIPMAVLQELDTFKNDNELGKNARIVSNILDDLYLSDNKTEKDTQVIYRGKPSDKVLDILGGNTVDNIIVGLAKEMGDKDVVILSNDTLVRVKARGVGITALKFTSDVVGATSEMIYTGEKEWETYGDYIDTLYSQKYLNITSEIAEVLHPHMFILVKEINGVKTAIGKVNADKTKLELVNPNIDPVWGITSRNSRQRMALRLLLDPEIPLVTMTGIAGTGKTLLALASGLVMSNEERFYDKVTLTKPVVPMGKDIGYLPGNKEEKLNPWLQSYYDNIDFLLDGKVQDLEQMKVQIEALTYIRGRSLPNQFIIIDEAQNLTKHEVKTIITRAGEGTKIILMGDPDQVDAPHLDSVNNGLVYVINRFKEESVAGHITLLKSERSELAAIASKIL